ncbi:MAG: hypothetical protein ACREJB_15385 [Planctomycetaceae bacterium]
MIQHIASLFTLAVMALHSVLGCYWHHAHAMDEPCLAHRAAHHDHDRAETPHRCGHSHAKAENAADLAQEPCDHPPHLPCGEETCKYVKGVQVEVPATAWAGDGDMPASIDLASQMVLCRRSVWLTNLAPIGLPPDRHVRDFTQVWLL